MKNIGFVCDVRIQNPPFNYTHIAVLDRAVPMAAILAEAGVELFLYSPHHVDPETGLATGYIIEESTFVKVCRPVPAINGIWFYNYFKQENNEYGMSIVQFREWAMQHQRMIFPSREFSRLISDKYSSYLEIAKIDKALHLPTQRYKNSADQLSSFLETQGVFLKPRFGGHGDGIFVVERHDESYNLRFYKEGIRWVASTSSLGAIVTNIKSLSAQGEYVIQPAINTRRYGDQTFDVRVMMVPSGNAWRCFPLLRLGGAGNDVSNVGQGGTLHDPKDILNKIYPRQQTELILDQIKDISLCLGNLLGRRYANGIPELALDFILDKDDKPWLVEMNIQPGMVFPGIQYRKVFYASYGNIFQLSEQEKVAYDNYTHPYGVCLAEYFLQRLKALNTPEITA